MHEIVKHLHWYYFDALSEDLDRTARFVEPTKDNFKAFSIEFARLYLAIGSEIDAVAKPICAKACCKKAPHGIDRYRPAILENHPSFPEVE
jgi:hypothetical protein